MSTIFFWDAVLFCGLGSPLVCAAMGSVGECGSLLPNRIMLQVRRVELARTAHIVFVRFVVRVFLE